MSLRVGLKSQEEDGSVAETGKEQVKNRYLFQGRVGLNRKINLDYF